MGRRSRINPGPEGVNHLANLGELGDQPDEFGFRYGAQVLCCNEVVLDLERRCESVPEEPSKFTVAPLRATLHDIRGNGLRGAHELTA